MYVRAHTHTHTHTSVHTCMVEQIFLKTTEFFKFLICNVIKKDVHLSLIAHGIHTVRRETLEAGKFGKLVAKLILVE